MTALFSTSVLAGVIVARAFPRFVWSGFTGSDSYFHRAYIAAIRDNHHRIPRQIPRFLIPSRVIYPALYHWILSFFPERTIAWTDKFAALVFDLVVAALLAQLLMAGGTATSAQTPMLVALYLIAPGLTMVHIGPRAYSLTPRNFAQLLYALWFVVLMMRGYLPQEWWTFIWEVAAVLLLVGLLLSSRFAIQVLVVTLPAIAVVLGPVEVLVQLGIAVVIAIVVSRGFFVQQILGQLEHLHWYVRYNQPFISHRGNWKRLIGLVRQGAVRHIIGEVLFHNPIISGLVRQPLLPAALFLALSDNVDLDVMQRVALALCLAAGVAWIATSSGRLRVFGEAERYLEFAFPAQWYLFWSLVPTELMSPTMMAIGVGFVGFYAVNLGLIFSQARLTSEGDKKEIAGKIRDFGEAVLLCLDDHDMYYFFLNTKSKLCAIAQLHSLRDHSLEFFEKRYLEFPYINPRSLDDICDTCNVDLVLLAKVPAASLEKRTGLSYDLGAWKLVSENTSYALYERPKSFGESRIA